MQVLHSHLRITKSPRPGYARVPYILILKVQVPHIMLSVGSSVPTLPFNVSLLGEGKRAGAPARALAPLSFGPMKGLQSSRPMVL